ncbi:hypothetical protein ACE04B_42745 [Rhizobium phaseoli]
MPHIPFAPQAGVRRTGRDPWLDPGRCRQADEGLAMICSAGFRMIREFRPHGNNATNEVVNNKKGRDIELTPKSWTV